MLKVIYGFSKYSHRTLTPNLLKDPRYTRQGYQKRSPLGRLHRNPSVPNDIANSHLYYDLTRSRETYEHQQANPHLTFEQPSLEEVVGILGHPTYVQKQDMKLMKGLKYMCRYYPDDVNSNMELFDRAFRIIIRNVRYLDIYNFRSLIMIAKQHYSGDEEVWRILFKNVIQFIVAYEQKQTPMLSQICPKDDQECFIYSFHQVMNKATQYKFDLTHLIYQLDILMRNHLRFSFHSPETFNKWENIRNPNNLALFLSDFTTAMSARQDFYNEYDQQRKIKMLEEFLHQGQQTLEAQLKTVNAKSLKHVKSALDNSQYKYAGLFDKIDKQLK